MLAYVLCTTHALGGSSTRTFTQTCPNWMFDQKAAPKTVSGSYRRATDIPRHAASSVGPNGQGAQSQKATFV